MSSLVRQLIALDILKQELDDVELSEYREADSDFLMSSHLHLLIQCSQATQQIIDSISGMSEYDFAAQLEYIELDFKVPSKQLLIIQHKLLAWVIDFIKAKSKVNKITAQDFSDQAEVRLDLWQSKAAKAKNQMKTLAKALGKEEYSEFISLYKLEHTELAQLAMP